MNVFAKTQVAEINCVSKSDRSNPHERITHVGGNGGGGWILTQESVITLIESRQWSFYVTLGWRPVKVVVGVSRFGNKYLRTEADSENTNNLLTLRECAR